MKKIVWSWLAAASLLIGLTSCGSDDKSARLEVWLTDAPADYKEVNIDIQGVEIHSSENDNGKGWKSLDVNKGVYNLLELTNGLDTLLGEIELPAGKVSQIRLILGENNSITVGSENLDLATPSALQSGLKLQVHETLVEGVTYRILLDFDVAQSVLQTGAGQYKLKPVIRAITEAQSGAIKGVVSPVESTPAIYAIAGTDTVATTFPNDNGNFLLRGIPAGTYKVTFEPNENYVKTEKIGVVVQTGSAADVGTVTISQK